jgi:hypothetical protein
MTVIKAILKLLSYFLKERSQDLQENVQQDTTEEFEIDNPYVNQAREWALNKIESLKDPNERKSANAIAAEFDEWIHISNENEMEYVYLEDQEWTDEQEIDVR